MKRIYILNAIFAAGIIWMICNMFPATMKMLECDSFFLTTKDYFVLKLSQGAGLNGWITDFLLQFFNSPLYASVINAILLCAVSITAAFLVRKINGNSRFVDIAIAVSCMLLLLFPFQTNLQIEGIVFYLALLIYVYLPKYWQRVIWCIIFVFVGYLMLSLPMQIMCIFAMAVYELWLTRNIKHILTHLCCITVSVAIVSIYSNYVEFIPYEQRYFYTKSIIGTGREFLYLGIFLLPFVAIVINRIQKQAYSFIMSVAMLVLIVFAISYNAYNSRFLYNEKIYNYILLADNKEWSELLSQLQTEGHNNNDDFIVKYSLLAESALGTLPEHLFQYPINNAEEFLFIHDRNPIGYLFNAMFYENAKVYDEAFHQYFEYSTLQNNGNCFTSLRHMIEYCIKEADFPVAEKYLAVLEKSTCHDKFVEEHRKQIQQLKEKGIKPEVAMRSDNFVGGYPFNSEMVRQLQLYPQSKTYLDYLLCGLLLQKKLYEFSVIIAGFPLYKGKELPRAYAEAAAMLEANKMSIKRLYPYPNDFDRKFNEFYNAHIAHAPEVETTYADSYWYYYFYTELPEEINKKPADFH